jgi:hypothetical protein
MSLPDLITLSEFNGNWDAYVAYCYGVFEREIRDARLTFLDLNVGCRRLPQTDSKDYRFWHLVSNNSDASKQEDDRIINLKRCERLRWIPYVLRQAQLKDASILCWEKPMKHGESSLHFWLHNHDYLVVLGRRANYFMLTTAFPFEGTEGRIKSERDYRLKESKKWPDPR